MDINPQYTESQGSRANLEDFEIAWSVGPESNTDLQVKAYTWEQFASRMSQVKPGDKSGSYIIRGGKMNSLKRSDHNLLEGALLVVDGEEGYDPETGELFKGTLPETGESKDSGPPIESAKAALDSLGYRYVLHTSHTYRPGVLNRWRAYIPCQMQQKDQLKACAHFIIAQLQAGGCHVQCVDEMTTWSQPWYLPRSLPKYLADFRCFSSLTGKDMDVAAAVEWYAAQAGRDEAVNKAQAERPKRDSGTDNFITRYNAAANEGWFHARLTRHGYKPAGRTGGVLRFMAKDSTTKTAGISVFRSRTGADLLCRSWHGAYDPLSHKTCSAFDLLMILDHGGDFGKAFEAAKRELGEWREAGSQDDFAGFQADAEDFTADAAAGEQQKDGRRRVWNPWSEHAVPAFPLDVLPPDVANYAEARAIETGACVSAIATSLLAAASGAISHEARVFLKPGSNYPASPRLWAAIIGPPSSKKSPAIEGAIKPLIKAQQKLQAEQMRSWREQQEEDGKKKNTRPELTKYTDNDMTPEAVVDTLSYQDRGMLIVADELSGFLTSFDRYGAGKGASAGRAVWLQAYNGGYYAASRVSRIVAPVNNLSVSILGGIQIDRLRELGNLTTDGLLQRFLPVLMAKPVLDSNSFDFDARKAWEARVGELLKIARFSTELEPDAQRERQRIAAFLFDLGQVESEGAAWQGFVGKLPGVWGSLALIMHCLWEPRVGTGLKAENALRASRLIEEFFLPHGLAFYREIAGGSQTDNRNIAGFLSGWNQPTVKARDFVRGPRCLRAATPDEIVKRLQPFEAGGWLLPLQRGPWNREWKVRPGLEAMFAGELAAYRAAIAAVQARIRGLADD